MLIFAASGTIFCTDQTFSPRGVFTFSDVQTSESGAKTNIANDIASFLLDQPSQTGRDLNTFFPRYRQWWFFLFASDKWQASPKLTLDLGVRWDFYPPATPATAGGFSNYNPVTNNIVITGSGGNPTNLGMETRYRYFAPRTGFAYRVTDDTVVRGGFGISYTPFPDNTYAYNYPIRANNSYQPAGSSAFTPAVLADGVTPATFQAGFPAPVPVVIPSNGIIPANTALLKAQVYTYIPLNYKNPYAESWNVVVQQAFRGNLSMQLAYVANHGVDISGSQNINNPTTFGGGAASEPENILIRTYRGDQPILPGLFLQLPVAPGPTQQAHFEWPTIYNRFHMGQGNGLYQRRRWRPTLLYKLSQKLRPTRLRSHSEL